MPPMSAYTCHVQEAEGHGAAKEEGEEGPLHWAMLPQEAAGGPGARLSGRGGRHGSSTISNQTI